MERRKRRRQSSPLASCFASKFGPPPTPSFLYSFAHDFSHRCDFPQGGGGWGGMVTPGGGAKARVQAYTHARSLVDVYVHPTMTFGTISVLRCCLVPVSRTAMDGNYSSRDRRLGATSIFFFCQVGSDNPPPPTMRRFPSASSWLFPFFIATLEVTTPRPGSDNPPSPTIRRFPSAVC